MNRLDIGNRRQRKCGVVLFVVVIVIALVSLSAYGFVIFMHAENQAAHLAADQMQVDQIAESGNAYLRTLAAQSRAMRDQVGGWHNNPNQFQDVVVDVDKSGTRHGRFSIVSNREISDDMTGPLFGVGDRAAKLSLEALVQWDNQFPGAGRTALMQLPGMNETLADSILDWMDADDNRREFGAEAEFYLGLDPPRHPPNRVPSVLEELLDVHGLSGVPAVPTDAAPPPPGERFTSSVDRMAEGPALPDIVATGTEPFWWRFLTPRSAERNESYDGQLRIDLNRSDLVSLYNDLSSRFGDELAKFVVALRRYGPSQNDPSGRTATVIPKIDLTEAATYEFATPLDIVDAAVAIPTSTDDEDSTERFSSPLSTRGGDTKLVDFCDQTTTIGEPIIVGRININQAPREVLLAIPGFPREAVEQLISVRGTHGDAERRHAVWLLVEDVLDRETLNRVLPFITTGGDVIEAQVVAYYDDQSPWARHRIVLDGTQPGVPALYFRDLGRLGRGFRFDQLSRQTQDGRTSPADGQTRRTRANNDIQQQVNR